MKTRYDSLTKEESDLEKAIKDLEKAIEDETLDTILQSKARNRSYF